MARPTVFVSPFEYDFLTAVAGGATPYLAGKRAELNKQRRAAEAARWATENGITAESWAGIDRAVAPRQTKEDANVRAG